MIVDAGREMPDTWCRIRISLETDMPGIDVPDDRCRIFSADILDHLWRTALPDKKFPDILCRVRISLESDMPGIDVPDDRRRIFGCRIRISL